MKNRIVIIEDNYFRYFTAKNLLEGQLRIPSKTIRIQHISDLETYTKKINPSILMFKKNGGAVEMMEFLQKRGANRRNTEVIILLAEEFNEIQCDQVELFVNKAHKTNNFAKVA